MRARWIACFLEEERRLAYVGLTRAKKRAFISFVLNRRVHNQWQNNPPSRFLRELSQDDIEILRSADTSLRAALEELLDSKDIGDIFKTRNPFSAVGGQFFCERVITMLDGIISGVIAEEAEASRKRTAKYIEEDSNAAGQPAADA